MLLLKRLIWGRQKWPTHSTLNRFSPTQRGDLWVQVLHMLPWMCVYKYYLIHISLIYTIHITFSIHILVIHFFSIIFKNTCVYFCFSTFLVTLFPLSYQCQSNLINISKTFLTWPKLDLPYYHLVQVFPTLKRRQGRNGTPMIRPHPAPLPLILRSHPYVVWLWLVEWVM